MEATHLFKNLSNYFVLVITSFVLMFVTSHHVALFMCDVQIFWFENLVLAIFPIMVGLSAYAIKRKVLKVFFIVTALAVSLLFFPMFYTAKDILSRSCGAILEEVVIAQ
jgi:hypothetical protein